MAAGSARRPLPLPAHLLALVAAWLLAAAWGSVVQTQFNLQALVALDVPVPPGLRARTTLQDLAGFAPVYAGILAAGWLPALGLAAWLARRWPALRTALFTVAAGAGMVAAVRAVDAFAPMPVFIDATRGWPGLLGMAAGAALGGWLYARLAARTRR
ncbi:hypothetical protein [Pseudorhodoferax sp. Leaf274]|uniref:hypothetical protein n=1 Tax=Pseudorhodoferax sp. Leaf274 TaxID=1736318 RepID=UPI0007026D39|nr:hypothetical protein [Pseudorhodoferax sp. Leaf274]KQP50000.1 hypothetical protein ASF44_05390 [Pseudorhodoferax sp. Leaf274]